ncbi:G5 domain-containing protein [Streptococcus sp. 4094]|uniref:G5 domain-containing protein n=1 Tax=Streptococcus sp. 4094 TaxID=2582652 RepID=UPI0015674B36|nr:G5 domain-containing protein [Streptococcus sp. 4094]
MSRQSTKNKKYALRKIGKVFGSCVVATVITLGGVAIMAPNVTVYASDTSSDEEPNIGELSSATEGYQVFVPKGKKYVRNDDVDYDPNAQPKLITEGHNGNSFILKAKPNKNLTEEKITDHFEESGNELENLFKKLYDDDGDGEVDPKYKRADADAINANAGQPLENDPNFVEPKVSEIDPKYPHRLDSGIYTPDKDDSNHDGKPDEASGEIDSDDSVVESNKPLTVNPDAEENVVTEDGNVVLSKYYRIHVNEGEDADKVDDVYEIGTKPKKEVETTPKTTRYVGDSDTPYNTKVTSVDGHDGSVTKKTTYDLNENTGEVTPKETVTTVEKEDKVVKVGNKEVTTEKIDITTHYTADPRLEKDRQETDNNGTEGTREITKVYEVSPTTGDLSNPTRTENVTVAMVPKEVRVGNVEKEVVETEITTRYIPDETRTRDEQEVVTPGSKGVHTKTTTYSVNPNTGETHTPVVTEDDKPMEQKVVKVGIKPVETTEIIDITTKYIQDPDLDYGKTVIDNPGSEGKIVTTTTYTLNEQDGTTTENQPTVQKTEMVQKVVRVGVKPKVEETPIPFPTRYERDDSIPNGEERETVKGVDGKTVKKTTYTMNPDTGVVTQNEPTTETTQPVTRVVKVGTQPKVDVTPVPSPKRYEKDPDKEKGQPNQEVPGKPGTSTTTTTYEVDPKTGKVTEKVGDPVVVEPTETVVKVPAKDKVVVEEIPVVTEYEDDPTLEPGTEKEVTPGQPGEKTTTTTYTVDGKTGDITETTTTQITKEMVKRTVKRGPKGTPSQPGQPTAPEEAPAQPGQPSEPEDQPNLKVAPPTIAIVEEANKASIEVKAPKKDADTVKITYPKSDGSGEEVLTLTKQPSGEWTLDKQPENVTLDKKTGTVTIPRESVVNKEKVQAQAKHKTSEYTPFVYAALSIEEANPEYPVTLWVDRAGKEIKEKVVGKKVQAGEIAGYKWLSSRLEEGILTHTFEKVANGTPILPESPTSHPMTPSSSPSTSTPEKPNKAETPAVRTVWRDENGKDLKVPSVDKQEAGEVPGYEFVESHREGDNLIVHVFRTKQAQTPAPKDQTPSPEQASSPAPSKVSEQKGEAVATATSEKTVDSATSTKTSDKAELPNTGTEANATLASAGIMTLLAGLGLGFFKKKED